MCHTVTGDLQHTALCCLCRYSTLPRGDSPAPYLALIPIWLQIRNLLPLADLDSPRLEELYVANNKVGTVRAGVRRRVMVMG